MKAILYGFVDVVFHILFWTGLPMTLVSFMLLTSFERVADVLTGQMDLISRLDGCQGSITVPRLMDRKYRIFVYFENSRFTPGDEAYFGDSRDEKARFFWETLGASLRITVLDQDGGTIPLISEDYPNVQFLFRPTTQTGQNIGALVKSQLHGPPVMLHYVIDKNCERLLSYRPQIQLYPQAHNELLVAKMGLVLLVISSPWVVLKRLPKAYAKFARPKPTAPATLNE